MKKIPTLLKYTSTHEWVSEEENNIACIGITDYAQEKLGDIVYVELPSLEAPVKKGQAIAVLESVKAASEVYAPLSGHIIEVNAKLSKSEFKPINSDPYGEGWLFRIQLSNAEELESLLSFEVYKQQISVESH